MIQANGRQCQNDPCRQSRSICTCHRRPSTPVYSVRHESQSKDIHSYNTGHLKPTGHDPYTHQGASTRAKKPTMNTSRCQTTWQSQQPQHSGPGQQVAPATDQHKPHSRQVHQNMAQHSAQKRQLDPGKYIIWYDQTGLHYTQAMQQGPHQAPAIHKEPRVSAPDAGRQEILICDPRGSQPRRMNQILTHADCPQEQTTNASAVNTGQRIILKNLTQSSPQCPYQEPVRSMTGHMVEMNGQRAPTVTNISPMLTPKT